MFYVLIFYAEIIANFMCDCSFDEGPDDLDDDEVLDEPENAEVIIVYL